MRKCKFLFLFCFCLVSAGHAIGPEINDQYENITTQLDQTEHTTKIHVTLPAVTEIEETVPEIEDNEIIPQNNKITNKSQNNDADLSIGSRIYRVITRPIIKFIAIPKVNSVLKNIGTCIVNGAMELITYYFPAPLIPLIATAAGMVIPFEPVVMLKERMPVTSYRRAFRTALNGFLRTFDRYKLDDDDDPYMTRRFNRRIRINSEEKNKDM